MRPPLSPNVAYTVMSDAAVRRQLASEHGLSRAKTSKMTLDQLQDAISRHMPPEIGALVVVVTERSFIKLVGEMDAHLLRLHGGPIMPDASLMTRTRALAVLSEREVEGIPENPANIDLEMVLTGLRGEVVHVLEDDAFAEYGAAMHAVLSAMPTGRPRAGAQDAGHVHDETCGHGGHCSH